MSEDKVKVKIEWQGNKTEHLPTGLKYITIAKFDNAWMQDTWSIVLEFEQLPNVQGNPSIGYAKFLMLNAPANKLISGVRFELYEGDRLTAKVTVI